MNTKIIEHWNNVKDQWPSQMPNNDFCGYDKFEDSYLSSDLINGLQNAFNAAGLMKDDSILEIGAGSGYISQRLVGAGWQSLEAIDESPANNKDLVKRINFKDLSTTKIYKGIFFMNILDYFEKGSFDGVDTPGPNLELLVLKLAVHLRRGGALLYFENSPQNENLFKEILSQKGFLFCYKINYFSIFRAP